MPNNLEELLARVPVAKGVRADLVARLRAPDRHYHGVAHVLALWQTHRRFSVGLPVRAEPWDTLIACAIAFHDAVYDARRQDNEAASALLWRSARPDLPPKAVGWVEGTILATADHLGATREPGMDEAAWAARLWMLDLDLAPLGEAPEVFRANTARLRREYAHLLDADWEAGRLGFLRRLNAVPRLFRTEPLSAAFEQQARANIAQELCGKPLGAVR